MTLFTSLLLLLLAQGDDKKNSSLAARINNEVIAWDDLAVEMKRGGAPNDDPTLRKAFLQRMAVRILMLQEAKKLGIKVEAKDVDAAIARDIQNFKSEENFAAWLSRRGMTRQQHRIEREQMLLQQRLISTKYYMWIQDPTSDSPAIHEFVTPTEMRNYYNSSHREFEAHEYVKLARITLQFQTEEERKERMKLAQSILRHIDVGTDFALLAQTLPRMYPDNVQMQLMDNFDRNNKFFPEWITTLVMDKMEKGQLSGILEDKGALHIIKVLEKVVQKEESFEEAQPKIRTILEYEKRNNNTNVLTRELIKNAYYSPPDLFDGLENANNQ
jgi:hypothetical protein